MIPIDKAGRKIFFSSFFCMLKEGKKLLSFGFKESYSKPNLFYKELENCMLFADMRGNNKYPMALMPVFYFQFGDSVQNWKRVRIFKKELVDTGYSEYSCRLPLLPIGFVSFDDHYFSIPTLNYEGIMTYFDFRHCVHNDGYCILCNADFQNDGPFCSDNCKLLYEKLHYGLCEHCEICGKELKLHKLTINWCDGIRHHLNYALDKTILICPECHAKIHHSGVETNILYKIFKPVDKRPKIERKYKLVVCGVCKRRFKLPIERYRKNILEYYCSSCDGVQYTDEMCKLVTKTNYWWNEK